MSACLQLLGKILTNINKSIDLTFIFTFSLCVTSVWKPWGASHIIVFFPLENKQNVAHLVSHILYQFQTFHRISFFLTRKMFYLDKHVKTHFH